MHLNLSAWIEVAIIAAFFVFLIIRPGRKGGR
jgi:hypothetical protein